MRGNTFSKKWAYRVKLFMYFVAALAPNAYFIALISLGTFWLIWALEGMPSVQ